MRVLYGVVGEGMGHAMRSAVILEHLVTAGHDVQIVVSGRAADYLETRHPGRVTHIHGLTMVYEDNVVQKLQTVFANFKGIADLPDNFRSYTELARTFSPDAVISDFESFAYWFARGQRLPVISVDNMQVIARCRHDDAIIGANMTSLLLAKSIVKAKLPSCNAYLITTFFYPAKRKSRTTLHPPILRKQVLDAKGITRRGEHVLCYQSAEGHDTLEAEFAKLDVPFRVYGLRRGIEEEQVEANVTHCPFSEERFIEDLAAARAVIAGGGFTLMSEAVFLGKPMLSVPLVGQFEQALNAAYLEHLGYGECAEEITAAGVASFLSSADRYAENLRTFQHDENRGLFAKLEEELTRAVTDGARTGLG